jgi:hypothetical protein
VTDVGLSNSASSPPISDLKPIEEDVPSKSQPDTPAEPVEVRVRSRKPDPEPQKQVWEELEDRPSRPVRSKSRGDQAISARPLRESPPAELEDEEEEDDSPRPRRFKRRRPRPKKPSSGRAWFWVRWVVVAVLYIVIGSAISIHMVATGHTEELIRDAISWAIMMPVSVVLFFVSMFIGSAIAGGIDFGDVRTAIPKAFFLLAPINAFYAFFQWYIGFFAAAPFWIFGLMFLFELDVWESWFIIVINWFLNVGANLLIGLMVLAMLFHAVTLDKEPPPADDFGNGQIEAPAEKPPPDIQKRPRRR